MINGVTKRNLEHYGSRLTETQVPNMEQVVPEKSKRVLNYHQTLHAIRTDPPERRVGSKEFEFTVLNYVNLSKLKKDLKEYGICVVVIEETLVGPATKIVRLKAFYEY